jgi:hypothetical protein
MTISHKRPNMSYRGNSSQTAAGKVLDTAYSALWAIRANGANWRAYRRQLGWIAVSGEDDLPHRPANIPQCSISSIRSMSMYQIRLKGGSAVPLDHVSTAPSV